MAQITREVIPQGTGSDSTKVVVERGIEGKSTGAVTGSKGDSTGGTGYGVEAVADASTPTRSSLHIGPQDIDPGTAVEGNAYVKTSLPGIQVHDGTNFVPNRNQLGSDGDASITPSDTQTLLMSTVNIPADLLKVGSTIRYKAFGSVNLDSPSTNTLELRLQIGGVLVNDIEIPIASGNLFAWVYDGFLFVRAVGSPVTLAGCAEVHVGEIISGANQDSRLETSDNTVSVDTAVSLSVELHARVLTADASAVIDGHGFYVDVQ